MLLKHWPAAVPSLKLEVVGPNLLHLGHQQLFGRQHSFLNVIHSLRYSSAAAIFLTFMYHISNNSNVPAPYRQCGFELHAHILLNKRYLSDVEKDNNNLAPLCFSLADEFHKK